MLPLCAALFYELVVERTDGQPIGRGDELVIIVWKKLLPNISCPPNTIPKNEGLLRTFKKNNIILKVLLVINDYRFNLLIWINDRLLYLDISFDKSYQNSLNSYFEKKNFWSRVPWRNRDVLSQFSRWDYAKYVTVLSLNKIFLEIPQKCSIFEKIFF